MTSSILRRLLLVLLLSLTSVSLAPPSLAVAGDRERKVADDDEDKANVHLIPVEDDDPTYGNREEALVTLVVFSDFECPFCQKGAKVMKELQTHYGKKDVRMVFKHLPLPFHKQAKPAARAAIAAHNQGQFWDMHDQLFYDREALKAGGSEYFISLANKIELDVKTFEKDFASKDTESKLEKDMELAKEVGARGTPNFFINGIQVVGARPADDFKSVIDDQIKLAKKLKKKKKSLKGDALYKKLVKHNKKHAKDPFPTKKTTEPDKVLSKEDFKKLRRATSTHILGKPSKAKVIIYEFTDIQCPFCEKSQETMKELMDRHGEDLAIVSFNFPLPFHKQGGPAARAVIAAGKQGKAVGMRELIFAEQKSLKGTKNLDARFARYAEELGLDVKKFKKDYDSKATKQQLEDEMELGSKLGVRGTPTFFVEDRRITGALPAAAFDDEIEDLKK